MIKTRKELSFYLQADRMMNRGTFKVSWKEKIRSFIMPDYIMDYLSYMRKADFYNSQRGWIYKLKANYYALRQRKLGIKLGFSISRDVFGYGLVIPHYGTIVVGGGNKIGNYAVLHTSTCITNGHKVIGDGLYVSTGAKLTTVNQLGDNITIAANSVLTSDIVSSGVLVVGMPAYIKHDSIPWFEKNMEYYNRRIKIENFKKQYYHNA